SSSGTRASAPRGAPTNSARSGSRLSRRGRSATRWRWTGSATWCSATRRSARTTRSSRGSPPTTRSSRRFPVEARLWSVTRTFSSTATTRDSGSSTRERSGCRTRVDAARSGLSSGEARSSCAEPSTTSKPLRRTFAAARGRKRASWQSCSPIPPIRRRRRRRSSGAVARSYVREATRRGLGRRRERIGPIVERLAAEHADAEIALRFRTDLELLVSVMLSAQPTDANANRVTPTLFAKYGQPEDYLAVPQEELERDIYATGFFRQKAKSIRGTMRMLLEEFDGEVPRRLEELVRLPGVARKTANVVAAELGH